MKQIAISFLLLLMLTGPVNAVSYRDISEVGSSAEMIGIGNIQGYSKTAAVLFENPVGLKNVGNSVSLFYTTFFGEESRYMATAISFVPYSQLTLGAGLMTEEVVNNDVTAIANDASIISVGSFDVKNSQFTVGGSYQMNNQTVLGASLIHYLSQLHTISGSGQDVMLGFQSHYSFVDIQGFGKNIFGSKIRYSNGGQETLKTSWGVSLKTDPFSSMMNAEFFWQGKILLTDLDSTVFLKSVGLRVYPLKTPIFQVGVGYRDIYNGNGIKGSFSVGVSTKLSTLSLEYAYNTTDVYQQESQHYFSVAIRY